MSQGSGLALSWPWFALLAGGWLLLATVPAGLLLRALHRLRGKRRELAWQLEQLGAAAREYALLRLDSSGHVSLWNEGAERLHGYAAGDILGRHVALLYPPEERSANVPQQQLELAAREGRPRLRGWRLHRDGARFCAEVEWQALRDATGRLTGFSCIERDISQTLEREQAFEQARRALSDALAPVALGQLSAGIAHEFNNVAQVIRTCVEALQRQSPGAAAPSDEFLQMIKRNSDHATLLSRQLQELIRPSAGLVQPLDVNATAGAVVALLRQTFSEQLILDLHTDDAIALAQVEEAQLRAALVVLAALLRDSLGSTGLLSISTGEARRTEQDGEPGARHYLVITLTARSGAREGAAPSGAALASGLAMVGSFAELSGGRLESEQATTGTTLRLFLPARAGTAGRPASSAPPPPGLP